MIPQEVSQSGAAKSLGPDMVVEDSGIIHLIWMDDKLGQADLYYVKSEDQGNTWSDAERIPTSFQSQHGSFALDITGTIHACWWDYGVDPFNQFSLEYAQRTADTWLQETIVLTASDIQEPRIAEAADYVYVIWSNKLALDLDLFYSRKPASGGSFSDATVITDTADSSIHAEISVDSSGNLHVVWQEDTEDGQEIMYISGTVGAGQTTWFTPITVTADLTPDATMPDVVVGDDCVVHTVFGVDVAAPQTTQDIYYASFPLSNTEDISPTIIPGSRVLVHRQLPTYASPSLALRGPDEVHVVWNGVKGADLVERIYYAVSEDHGASWSEPMAISPDDGWADGFSTIGTYETLVHVAWQQKGLVDDSDIYYSHSLPFFVLYPLALKDYS